MSAMPKVLNKAQVGNYDLWCCSGAGMVWDDVLEYRVWYRDEDNELTCDRFDNYDDAEEFAQNDFVYEPVLALVLQKECAFGSDSEDIALHEEERITEWCCEWLEESNHRPTMLLTAIKEAFYGN